MRTSPCVRPFLLSLLLAFGLVSAALVAQAPRYALVIGNGNYKELGKLKNPVNDATDMAAALRELGFQVNLLTDAELPTMEDAVVRLGSSLAQSPSSIGFFFYAGHGVQSGGSNYLIPADAHIPSETFLRTKALSAQEVLDCFQGAHNALNIVVLDACRDNPFSWGRSTARGLSVVGIQPPGSIVAYATSAGSVAQDGTGRNGAFTAELLKQIGTPGLEIAEVFKRTGAAVQEATTGRQVPAVYNQFFGNAYLAGSPAPASATQAAPALQPTPAAAPMVTVTKSYGSLTVSAASPGALYLDGAKVAELGAGDEARLDQAAVGDRSVELRYADGKVETKAVRVQKGQAASLSFSYQPSPSAPLAPAPGQLPTGFVLVPGGSFTMGSPAVANVRPDELIQHQVTLSSFAIGKYDVTFDEYDAYCAATRAAKPSDSGMGRGSRPVVNVNWYDAVAYCNWRSKQEGREPAYTIEGKNVSCNFGSNGYRLPTEAEWEYAAKGGEAGSKLAMAANAIYAGSSNLDSVAWYANNSGRTLHPVGQKAPNSLGLYDMAGNVGQMCWDWSSPYNAGSQSDPTGGNSGQSRVNRGGCFISTMDFLRSTVRGGDSPGTRYKGLGFRLVLRP